MLNGPRKIDRFLLSRSSHERWGALRRVANMNHIDGDEEKGASVLFRMSSQTKAKRIAR